MGQSRTDKLSGKVLDLEIGVSLLESRVENRPAPLTREDVEGQLDILASRLGEKVGVSLTHDANGAWGRAGTTTLTLRWGDMQASFELVSVRSDAADEDRRRDEAEAYK